MAKTNKELAVELTIAMIDSGNYRNEFKKSLSLEEIIYCLEQNYKALESLNKHEE